MGGAARVRQRREFPSARPARCPRMPGPLNPTRKKHRFGKAWMHDHVNDPYVQEAQRRGYRSRAAFTLLELGKIAPPSP